MALNMFLRPTFPEQRGEQMNIPYEEMKRECYALWILLKREKIDVIESNLKGDMGETILGDC